jgi:hypothetical protein
MKPRFQADEDLNRRIVAGLRRREPSIDFQDAEAGNVIGKRVLAFDRSHRGRV